MSYVVDLKVTEQTHQRFIQIHQRLNAGEKETLSKPLGNVLADVAYEVIDQVFADLLRKQKAQATTEQARNMVIESEKVIQQVQDTLKKYMPYSVSLFGNDRLLPLVNYLLHLIREKDGQFYLHYAVDNVLVKEAFGCIDQVKAGNHHYIVLAFKALTQIVDQGVTALIREPKKLLKFNLVVDKTLNGVINMTTHLGYKRLEKLGSHVDPQTANQYIDHFLAFLGEEN